MLELRKDYPNTTKIMSNAWIYRFEKSDNPEKVEKLFDYLEGKFIEISKELDPLTQDLQCSIDIFSRNWKNYIQMYFEQISYNVDYDAWDRDNIYPVALEVQIADYYLDNNEIRTQQKLEDFLVNLPDNLDQALI